MGTYSGKRRNIKTTLGVQVLRCLKPRMVEKHLCVHLLAYILIRLLRAQPALDAVFIGDSNTPYICGLNGLRIALI